MPFLGELSALSAACLWAGTSLIFASVTAKIGSVQVNINRMIFAVFLVFLSIFILDSPIHLSHTQVLNLVLSAILGIVVGDTFLFKAFQQIGARISMLIMSLSPAISTILGYVFLQELLSLWAILGIIVTLSGIALVVLERTTPISSSSKITKIGLLCAFLGAFGQGAGVVLAKKAFAEGPIHGLVATLIRISAALIILLPAAIAARRYHNPIKVFGQNRRILVLILIGSVFGTYLGITLSLIAIAYTKVGIASTLIATSPVVMLPIIRIVYKQELSGKAIIGACIAVSGVAMLFLT
jgi:drug/metabolite transporter (DMT)-like permease